MSTRCLQQFRTLIDRDDQLDRFIINEIKETKIAAQFIKMHYLKTSSYKQAIK